ncbi:MAG: DUF4412 domain-containing protein [Calditrichaeota bacterium]|nr:DUF4412 domain-containing protein [Calditrichota bacterium]
MKGLKTGLRFHLIVAFLFFYTGSLPLWGQVFEGYWEQVGQVTSLLPMMGKTVEKEDHRIFITADKIKTVDLNDGRTNIFRYDRKMIYRLDPANKTVAEISFSNFETMMKRNWQRMDRINQRMREKMKSLTPRQRRLLIQLLGGDPGKTAYQSPKITVRWLPGSKTILGYRCRHLQLLANGTVLMDADWTKDIRLPRKMFEIFYQFGYFPYKLPERIRTIDGFPLKSRLNISFGAAKISSETRVTKIRRTHVARKEFDIPKSYKSIPWTYMKLF